MVRNEFLDLLDCLFELPSGALKGPERLEELGHWDSMGMLGFIAMADEHCGITLSPKQFLQCSTVNDLLALLPQMQS
jgi:acyl carrier protein